ncbi:MAG: GNAT family N-acetyltransferase [Planctomycetaceae bacterium]|nr:GNAT family N-acetyltransferase [Planctomycetaceae bacterium]
MTVWISEISLDDVETVVPLFDEYRQFYGQASDIEGVHLYLSQRLNNCESVIFVAQRDHSACGFTQLYPSFSSISMKPIWILNDLFVRASDRRRGVGYQLLQTAIEYARKSHACRLALATERKNLPAQTLYEQSGWVKDEIYIHYNHPLNG